MGLSLLIYPCWFIKDLSPLFCPLKSFGHYFMLVATVKLFNCVHILFVCDVLWNQFNLTWLTIGAVLAERTKSHNGPLNHYDHQANKKHALMQPTFYNSWKIYLKYLEIFDGSEILFKANISIKNYQIAYDWILWNFFSFPKL